MANVNQIIQIINQSILGIDALKGFELHGIATLVKNENKKNVPCIIADDGNAKDVSVDDNYPGVIYHRVLSSNWSNAKENNYGDGLNRKLEQHELVLVAYVKLSRVGIQPNELASILNGAFPNIIDKKSLCNKDVFSGLVEFQSAEYDSENIYKQEYNADTPLSTESYMIKIKYAITMKVNANCAALC